MSYPAKILPHPSYKLISCDLSNHYLGRYTNTNNKEDLVEKSTGYIKQEYICQPSDHGSDLSTSLIGVFETPYFKIQLTEQGKEKYNDYCEPDIEISLPRINEDYVINNERHFWILLISMINNKTVDYSKAELAFTASSRVCHTPMKWNYWHFSIRWLTNDGYWHELPESEKKKKWAKRLAHEVRSFIALNAKVEERNFNDLAAEYYFKEASDELKGVIF